MHNLNKRALGRTPKEKVKDHSEAIYRGPLMLYTKYQGSSRFSQEDFLRFLYITLFKLDMPRSKASFYTRGIISTFFLATNQNHFNNFGRGPGIIPVEFSQFPISVAQEKNVKL